MAVSCSLLDPIYHETRDDFFASGSAQTQGTSYDVRPDALSPDYKTAFSYGPVETGSVENGLVYKVWRVDIEEALNVSSSVWISRENTNGTGWRMPARLFQFDSQYPVDEIDLAFSSDGRAVIAGERKTGPLNILSGSQVWLYWFSPFSSSFQFQNFGTGKTPRVVLDGPDTPENSDILFMYIKNNLGQVYFRQQRDQYATEYFIPLPIPSSVSGTLSGAISGALNGEATGSVSGTISDYFSGSFSGGLIGTGSGESTGRIFEISNTSQFTGSMFGSFTGSFTGSLDGTFNGNVESGINLRRNGFLAGIMSGSFTGSYTGEVFRYRNYTFSGSFHGINNGILEGSLIGTGIGRMKSSVSGYVSGAISGAMAGDISGLPVGSQEAYFETYLEDAVKLRDSRIAIFYSQRNTLNNSYQLKRFESVLYPLGLNEQHYTNISVQAVDLVETVLPFTDIDRLTVNYTFITSSLSSIVYIPSASLQDALVSFDVVFVTSSLKDYVIITPLYSNSHLDFEYNFLTSSLDATAILYNENFGQDAIGNWSISLSGSLKY